MSILPYSNLEVTQILNIWLLWCCWRPEWDMDIDKSENASARKATPAEGLQLFSFYRRKPQETIKQLGSTMHKTYILFSFLWPERPIWWLKRNWMEKWQSQLKSLFWPVPFHGKSAHFLCSFLFPRFGQWLLDKLFQSFGSFRSVLVKMSVNLWPKGVFLCQITEYSSQIIQEH